MTKNEIIRIAREAGLYDPAGYERFAKLVAAAEREACAKEAECIEACYDDSRGIAAAIRARGTP